MPLEKEIHINSSLMFADEKYQIYQLISNEDVTLRQLDSKKVTVDLQISYEDPEKYRLVLITNHPDANSQISVRNEFIPLYAEKYPFQICIYNNSNFKGLTIHKGDILGSLVFGF